MARARTLLAFAAVGLIALQVPLSAAASESCQALKDEVKDLCIRTLGSEPVWMSCAYYYRNAFEVLHRGGDEKWSLADHCRSLAGTMARVRERKQERGELAEAIPASHDPGCPAQLERLTEACIGLLDREQLPPSSDTDRCAGRLGLFERGVHEDCRR